MDGHGSPLGMQRCSGPGLLPRYVPFDQCIRFSVWAFVSFLVLGATWADDPASDKTGESSSSLAASQLASLDEYTAPFQLRVADSSRPFAVASASTEVTVAVRGLSEFARRSGTLRGELLRVEDGAIIARVNEKIQLDQQGDSPVITLLEDVPGAEGVYEVRCRLIADRNPLWARIAGDRPLGDEKRFPLMVVAAPASERKATRTVLRALAPVQPFDRDSWHPPSWVPQGASNLVPNVNQFVADPWKASSRDSDSASSSLCTIEPGGEFVCKLPEMAAHQRHVLSFAVKQRRVVSSRTGDPSKSASGSTGEIEVAIDPEFRSVIRRHALSMPQYVSDADNDAERLELVHYATGRSEFLRVRNPSPRFPLELHSIEAFIATSEEVDASGIPATRRVMLDVTASDWSEQATADIVGLDEKGFADATVTMFRLWKASQRVAENADWFGCNVLNVRSESADLLVRSCAIEAVRRWLVPEGIAVPDEGFEHSSLERVVLPRLMSSDAMSVSRRCRAATAASELVQVARSKDAMILDSEVALPALTQGFRQSLRELRYVPASGELIVEPVDEASQYVLAYVSEQQSMSTLRRRYTVSFVNTAPWRATVELRCCESGEADCTLVDDDSLRTALRNGRTSNLRLIDLPPLGIVSVIVNQPVSQTSPLAWRAVTDGPEVLERIQKQVGQVVTKIGMLAQPDDFAGLRNGSFEETGSVGIVGWMSTQFPADAVVIDSSEAVDGQHSVKMTTTQSSAGQTWLVSEPIAVPHSGRLAVSLAVRAAVQLEFGGNANGGGLGGTHRVRISLEGNRRGRPIRYTGQFDIPRDGHWQSRRLVLETDGLDAETEFVRLTIDSLSAGQIWVDDIHLHDHFPTQAERTALQGSAFLAIQGLQKGRLQEAADLLRNNWSQHLLSNRNRRWPTARTVAHHSSSRANRRQAAGQRGSKNVQLRGGVQSPPAEREKESGLEPRPSMAERIRSWLPRPLRF